MKKTYSAPVVSASDVVENTMIRVHTGPLQEAKSTSPFGLGFGL